ncbi:hypothetical protein BC832DRAFT_596196 [Gaertneriomyces semiglobifer]|nr:hypothetical protein BC832DRAFT_596196 [Gaertneriomyces semiglobifer]
MHMDFGDVPNLRFDFTLCPHTGKVIKEELTDALQQLPQQKQEEYSQAQAFLADLENVCDVYSAGPTDIKRWRKLVNIQDRHRWKPHEYHDELMKAREFHARSHYEHLMLKAVTEPSWIVYRHLSMMADISLLELRTTEVRMGNYQLVCGMVYVCAGHEQLYRAATFCHGVHKYLLQCISLFANRLPPDYNQLEAPSREQIPNDLFRVFGHQLSYISCIMDEFIPLIRNHTADLERAGVTFTDFVKQMGKRLTLVVRAMDDIFQVVS